MYEDIERHGLIHAVEIDGNYILTGDLEAEDEFSLNGSQFVASSVYVIGADFAVSNGACASDTTIYEAGKFTVCSGASAINTLVDIRGYFYITDYGKAVNTTLNGGSMYIYNGGTASHTMFTVEDCMFISSGGTASDTTINYNGSMLISTGASAITTTVRSYGNVFVYEGGTAFDTTVLPGGYLAVSNGTANGTTLTGGSMYLSSGTANSTTLNGGNMLVYGATANSTTVNAGASMSVCGTVNSTTVNGGALHVSWGTVNDTTVTSNGSMLVSGGIINNTTITSSSIMHISRGVVADNITVNSGGSLVVSSGGTATDIAWTPCEGHIDVAPEAVATFVSEYSGVYYGSDNQLLSHAATMERKDVSQGEMYVFSGGSVDYTTVNYSGTFILSGGVAMENTVNHDGVMVLCDNGWAYLTSVNYGGIFNISSGKADNNTVSSGGSVVLLPGGVACYTVVKNGGYFVASGGTITGRTTVEKGATFGILMGNLDFDLRVTIPGVDALINDMSGFECLFVSTTLTVDGTVENGDYKLAGNALFYKNNLSGDLPILVVDSSGTELGRITSFGDRFNAGSKSYILTMTGNDLGVTVADRCDLTGVFSGYFDLTDGMVASGVKLTNIGSINVSSGGMAIGTTIDNVGALIIHNGGTATGTTVSHYGYLVISSGGKVTGKTKLEADATVSAFSGGILDFDLRMASVNENDALVNGLSYITGDGFIYTLTVDETRTKGFYRLADNAAGFTGTIKVVNPSGTELGTLTVNGDTQKIDGEDYSLTLTDGSLYVWLGEKPDLTGNLNDSFDLTDGKCANNVFINNAGVLNVTNGTALNTTVNSGGVMVLFENGTAEKTTVNNSGLFNLSGGVANSTTVSSGGTFSLLNGGVASNTTVSSGGRYVAVNGGTITGRTTVEKGASFGILLGILDFDLRVTAPGADALINDMSGFECLFLGTTLTVDGTVENGDYKLAGNALFYKNNLSGDLPILVVDSSGTELGRITSFGDRINIGDKSYILTMTGNDLGITVGDRCDLTGDFSGKFDLTDGMVASGARINAGGELHVSDGGTATDTTVNTDGSLFVSSGGVANNATVNSSGAMTLTGGTANNTLVNSYGSMALSGGIANSTTVNYEGTIILSGGTANSIVYNSGGRIFIYDGGIANSAMVNSGCRMFVSNGGVANSTTVNSGGMVYVSNGGTMNNTTVSSDGKIFFFDADTLNNITVSSGGSLSFSVRDIGILTGRITFEPGAIVNDNSLGRMLLDFNISELTPGGDALVNDLSFIQKTFHYRLTVDGAQADGVYSLADGAAGFNSTITVVNVAGDELGTLSVGEKVSINDMDYMLNLGTDDVLSVTVGAVAPEPEPVAITPEFLTGRFAGGIQSMLAKQADGVVTIYQNGEPWGAGLTLDPGWDVVGTGDFNADGRDDFLRVNTEGYVVGEMANDNGTFSPQVLNMKGPGWDILGTGDFNGNGSGDVLVANPTGASETVGLLGYWESGVTWTLINGYSPEWECVSTGDFNGDGKCDMLWRNSFIGEGGLTYNAYCTWIVENAVDWRMVSVANPTEWNFLCSGDFDGNGSHDIAMINDVGVVGIWGVSDGYLSSWSILSAVDTSAWTLAGVGDFNTDGTDDIAWASDELNLAGYWQINDKQLTTWANIASLA